MFATPIDKKIQRIREFIDSQVEMIPGYWEEPELLVYLSGNGK